MPLSRPPGLSRCEGERKGEEGTVYSLWWGDEEEGKTHDEPRRRLVARSKEMLHREAWTIVFSHQLDRNLGLAIRQ